MVNFPATRFENLTFEEIKSLPTLDEVFDDILAEENKLIRTCHENPMLEPILPNSLEYVNHQPLDMFFVTRLKSRDRKRPEKYALKPNLRDRAFLFRGQSVCKNPSVTSALRKNGRYVSENIRYLEFCNAIKQHPLIRMQLDGIVLNGHRYFFEVNFQGLAQHYGLKTFVMDMTSDVESAKFFAVTDYSNGSYTPVLDENRYGMVYYYDSILNPFAFQIDRKGNQMSSIGLQMFPRSGRQKGFLYLLRKGDNLNTCLGIKWRLFRHDANISMRVFNQAEQGAIYFPKDELSSLADRIRDAKVLPWDTFEENLNDNPDDDREQNIILCGNEGLYFSPDAEHISFTEQEKAIFRERIANGLWDTFCNHIVFAENHQTLISELRDIPNREEYKQYFVWE